MAIGLRIRNLYQRPLLWEVVIDSKTKQNCSTDIWNNIILQSEADTIEQW